MGLATREKKGGLERGKVCVRKKDEGEGQRGSLEFSRRKLREPGGGVGVREKGEGGRVRE